MTTHWPLLKARVVLLAPSLAGWETISEVYPGPVPTQAPPKNYATIGYDSGGESGSYTQEQNTSGFETNETGSLTGEIRASVGDADPLITEGVIFGALEGLHAAIVADRRLGVLPPQSSLSMYVTLAPVQTTDGTGYLARFSLNYFAVS